MDEEEKKLITLNPDDYYDEQVFNKNFEYLDERIIELDQNKAKLIDGKVPLSQLIIDTELSQDSQAPIGNRFLKIVIDKKADLNENGKIPEEQLPSYVDDVVEYDTYADFPEEGETGKIYVDVETNTTYRWSGSMYVRIGKSYDEDIERIDESIKAIKGTADGQFIYDTEAKMTKVVPDGVNKGIVSMIGGKTVKMVQLANIPTTHAAWTENTVTATFASDYSITLKTSSATTEITNFKLHNRYCQAGHKYLFMGSSVNVSVGMSGYSNWTVRPESINGVPVVTECTTSNNEFFVIIIRSGITVNSEKVYPQMYDLTAMFGSGKEPTAEEFMAMYEDKHFPYAPSDLLNAPVTKVVLSDNEIKSVTNQYIDNGVIKDSPTRILTNAIVVKPNDVLTIKNLNGKQISFAMYDASENFLRMTTWAESTEYTVPSDAYFIRVLIRYSNNTNISVADVKDVGVYSDLNKTTLLLDRIVNKLPDYGCSAGDVYNYIDFDEMIYHHRVRTVKLDTLTWRVSSVTAIGGIYETTNITDAKPDSGGISSRFIVTKGGIGNVPLGIRINHPTIPNNTFINIDEYTDVSNAVKNQTLVYELATEELIDISDLLMPFMLESGGTITFENEHNLDVPNTVIYEKEMK